MSESGRAREFYGFVAFVSTSLLWSLYLAWALVPDSWLLTMGIKWYPNREWAILLPAWSVTLVLITYFAYLALALFHTPGFSELRAFTDEHALIPRTSGAESGENPYITLASPNAIPEIYDIPIGLVNRVLYRRQKSNTRPNVGVNE